MRKADFMTGVRELAASGAVQDPREKQCPSLDLSSVFAVFAVFAIAELKATLVP